MCTLCPGRWGYVRPSSSAPGDAWESLLLYSRFACVCVRSGGGAGGSGSYAQSSWKPLPMAGLSLSLFFKNLTILPQFVWPLFRPGI